jgi:N-succinyldiaminopimelate aminotransferase
MPATKEPGICRTCRADPAVLERTAVDVSVLARQSAGRGGVEAYWREAAGAGGTHDFKIFADECYSEIYRDAPPSVRCRPRGGWAEP